MLNALISIAPRVQLKQMTYNRSFVFKLNKPKTEFFVKKNYLENFKYIKKNIKI